MGGIPACALNVLEKYNGSVKPHSAAKFFTPEKPCRIRAQAFCMRISLRYVLNVILSCEVNNEEMYLGLYENCLPSVFKERSGEVKFSSIYFLIKAAAVISLRWGTAANVRAPIAESVAYNTLFEDRSATSCGNVK